MVRYKINANPFTRRVGASFAAMLCLGTCLSTVPSDGYALGEKTSVESGVREKNLHTIIHEKVEEFFGLNAVEMFSPISEAAASGGSPPPPPPPPAPAPAPAPSPSPSPGPAPAPGPVGFNLKDLY